MLRSLWNYPAALLEVKRIRLWCRQLYGESLIGLREYGDAKKMLESVEHDQRAQPDVFGEGSTESVQVARLLRRVNKALKSVPQKRGGCILRRCI